MKKIALTSTIILASISVAQAAPTVYGKALLTAEYTDFNDKTAANKDTTTTKLVSNSSRIGLKGSEGLTANTDLVYQLEYGIDVDADSNNRTGNQQFYSRNTYLGVTNKQYGTLLAGRHDTPLKLTKGSVDVFNDYDNVSLGNVMAGENRVNNVLAYRSPKLSTLPVTFMVATSLSENDDDSDYKALGTSTTKNYSKDPIDTKYYGGKTNKDNAYSASAIYDEKGVYLGVGYDSNFGLVDNAWRIAGSVDMGKMNMVNGLTLGALYQNSKFYDYYTNASTTAVPTNKNYNAEDEKSWLISGKYKIASTPWAVKAQYIDTKNRTGVKDKDMTEVALGGEYTFNSNTKGHIYAAQIDTKNVAKSDKTIVGAGLEYKF